MPTSTHPPEGSLRRATRNVRTDRPRVRIDGDGYDEDLVHDDDPPGLLFVIWPLLAGLIGAITSTAILDWLMDKPAWATTLVFPFMLLARRHELGLSDEMTRTLPQLMLTIQFPVEGLYAMMAMRRRHRMSAIALELVFLHLLGAFVLWLLNQQTGAPLH